jgi:hypothetical protein
MMDWCILCPAPRLRILHLHHNVCSHICCCCCYCRAVGSDDGLVQFVPSAPLSRILAEHRTIHKYLAQTQADPQGESTTNSSHCCCCCKLHGCVLPYCTLAGSHGYEVQPGSCYLLGHKSHQTLIFSAMNMYNMCDVHSCRSVWSAG